MNTVLVTGGFDPLHSGHIEYFKSAKQLGNRLVVGLNSDTWLENKKGKAFMPFEERANIVRHLEMVDDVILVEDDDTGGTTKAIGIFYKQQLVNLLLQTAAIELKVKFLNK